MRIAFHKSSLAAWVQILRAGWHRVETIFERALPSGNATREFSGFRCALDQSPQPIAFSDSLGSFRYANRAFLELLGYNQEQQIYRRWLFEFLAHPEQSGEILSTLRERGMWRAQTEARRSDSSELPVEIAAFAIGREGDWAHWYFFTPVAPLAECNQPEDVPALAAAGLAHDLNNLLTIITGYSQLALTRAPEGPDHRLWKAVLDTGQRAAEINQQIFSLSTPPSSAPEPVSLDAAVREAADVLARLAGAGISIQMDLAAEGAAIGLQRTELLQILMNLVVNSRDAISGEGLIIIETSRSGEEEPSVTLAVRDTGAGMDEATRSRAFEAFFTSKTRPQNSGLGLAIVASLVRKAGGRARIDSHVGAGANFQLCFPEAARSAVTTTKE